MGGPSGTVTFLFTDIEGSTRLWQDDEEAMRVAVARHDELLHASISEHSGVVFSTMGDGVAAAFGAGSSAVAAALDLQRRLGGQVWPTARPIRVRVGLHTGEAEERGGDYFGTAVNRAARLMAIGHGGQVLCSAATAALLDRDDLVDLGEHRLRDLDRPLRVFQVGQGRFPPLRSVDAEPTNLPIVRTELIGRSEEIARLSATVEANPLVTFTGTGGVGKTRLALAVAAHLAPGFPDGTWFVELAAVGDGPEVPRAVAGAIGVAFSGLEPLVSYLTDRRMIVVLDNCEHLVRDVAVVVDRVLAAAPDVHVLVTSREPLGVDGEVVRRVESLGVPDADAPSELARAAPAVQLFCARAASASERFVVDETTIAPIVEICRRLDGVPLAIELAAARTRALAPAVIAASLDERLRLLSAGSTRAQDRHRTLQAAVSWSHDLLSDEERVVFRRLAVFPASFDLPAAEAVAGLGKVGTVDVVARLVDRSLLQYDPDAGRYRLLETLRQFAAERLGEAGEGDDSRARHAEYFVGMAARLAPELRDGRYAKAHGTLTAELENLRATVEWCCSGERWPALATMLVDLWNFLFQLGPSECQGWFDELLAHEAEIEQQQAVDILAEEAWLLFLHAADRAQALALADRSITLAGRNGLRQSPGAWIAKCHHLVWAPDEAGLRRCERAIAVAEDRDDIVALVVTMGERALGYALLGHLAEAETGITQTRDRAAASGHPICLQSFALYAGIIHLFGSASAPDFTAAYEAITSNDVDIDDAMATFVDIFAGAALVGLHRAEAVDRLARAALRADRRGTNNASELALVLLAVLAAQAGRHEDGAMLAGYARANYWTGMLESPGYSWISSVLDEALRDVPDRQVHESLGERANRRDITSLVRALSDPVTGLAAQRASQSDV